MRENMLFSGEIYTAGKIFTVTAVTNLTSDQINQYIDMLIRWHCPAWYICLRKWVEVYCQCQSRAAVLWCSGTLVLAYQLDDLPPLYWDLFIDNLSNIQRTQKYSAVMYYYCQCQSSTAVLWCSGTLVLPAVPIQGDHWSDTAISFSGPQASKPSYVVRFVCPQHPHL